MSINIVSFFQKIQSVLIHLDEEISNMVVGRIESDMDEMLAELKSGEISNMTIHHFVNHVNREHGFKMQSPIFAQYINLYVPVRQNTNNVQIILLLRTLCCCFP